MASINLSEYNDCIFVINIDGSTSTSKILGTFFSKELFTVNPGNSRITGQDIIYLPTYEDEQSYNYENNDINIPVTSKNNNVYFVHTAMNTLTANANNIYSVTISSDVTIADETEISSVENITSVDSFELPTSIEGREIKQISDDELNNKADAMSTLIDEIQKTINELSNVLKGGGENEYEYKKTKFETVIYKFKDFVNRFITDSIIFQINSLNAQQIKDLFKDTTININNTTYTRNEIKKPLFDNIYSDCFDFYEKGKYVITDENDLLIYDENTSNKATYLYIFNPLIKVIDHDTNMYKNITNVTTETKQIHIYQIANQFINFYNQHYNALQTDSYFNGIIDNIYTIINDILERFRVKVTIKGNVLITVTDIIKAFHASNNKYFRIDLGKQLQNNAADNIITYVKINNFEKDQYNKRFDILIKGTKGADIAKSQNAMIVGYNDHNFPYYIKEGDKWRINDNKLTDTNYFKILRDGLTVEKYKNKYLFGNYTQIFKPDKSNQDIAQQMDDIKKQVISGKPVFMLGYGASGSGKTSSLIYFNKGGEAEDKKNGILIHLCNILGKEGYTKIEMTAKEYFTVTGEKPDNYCKGNNEINDPIHCDTNKFTFTYDGNFKLDKDNEHKSTHEYRKSTHEYRVESSPMVKFNQYDDMGKVMIYLIDQDRFVKATTNNPQSSRSHSIIYLKLTHSDGRSGYIIVGDYAGVENEFTCENASTIIDFLEKNRDCGNEDKTTCKPYYSDEFIPAEEGGTTKIFDSFNDIGNGISVENDDAVIYSNKETVKDMVVNFVSTNTETDGFNDLLYNVCNYNQKNYSKYNENENKNKNKKISDILYEYLRHDTSDLTNIKKNISDIKTKINGITGITMNGGSGSDIDKIQTLFNQSFLSKKDIEKIASDQSLKDNGITVSTNDDIDIKYDYTKDNKFNEYFTQKYNEYVLNKCNSEYEKAILTNVESNKDARENFYNILNQYHLLNKNNNKNLLMLHIQVTKNIKKPVENDSIINLNEFFKKIIKNEKNIYMIKQYNDKIEYSTNTILNDYSRQRFTELIYEHFNILKMDNLRNKVIDHYKINNTNPSISIFKEISLKNIPIFTDIDYTNIKTQYNSFSKGENFIEQIRKSYFNELYENITNIKQEEINAKNDEIKSSLNANMKIIEEFISIIEKRFNYGKQICANRVFEGKFINESLRQIRENIKDIITVKSQDKVFNSPDYIDICLEQYCPTHADCFKTNPIGDTTTLEIKSVLIKSIYDYIKTDKGPEYKVEQFYKDILISIFCVFNISRQANNPPPVPYIDINDLKIEVAIYKPEKEIKIIEHLKKLYYKLNNGKKLIDDSAEYVDETTFEPHQVSVILSSTEYNEIYKDNKIFEVFDIKTIKRFIETIDNNNAVSAIGTLEFLDQIAKYNTTNTICSSNKIDETNVQTYIDVHRFDNLYEKTI